MWWRVELFLKLQHKFSPFLVSSYSINSPLSYLVRDSKQLALLGHSKIVRSVSFADTNVCETACNKNATCTVFIGSFDCTCNPGFSGDGLYCQGHNARLLGGTTTLL